jgi:hypothetical protein
MKMIQSRLLSIAVAASLSAHMVILGGACWWRSGSASIESQKSKFHEIKVRVRPDTKPVAVAASKKPNRVYRPSGHTDQSSRIRARAAAIPAVSAQRLLNDPKTGLIFSAYFKAVRARLAQAAADAGGSVEGQSASVRFVLARDGRVLSSSVQKADSSQAAAAANKILEDAGSFLSFPSAISHDAISFDVRFKFDAG